MPSCPREELPESMIIQPCSINWANVARVSIVSEEGSVHFTAGSELGQRTLIQTQSEWEFLLTAPFPNQIVMSPRVTNASLVPGDAQTDEGEDQSIDWAGDYALSIMELTFRGLSPENAAQLNKAQGEGLEVTFILKDGSTLGNTIIGGGGETNIFFKSELITFSGRNHETGATVDTHVMTIHFEKENILAWEIFDTNSFGLII